VWKGVSRKDEVVLINFGGAFKTHLITKGEAPAAVLEDDPEPKAPGEGAGEDAWAKQIRRRA
jgi:hypothetical protein